MENKATLIILCDYYPLKAGEFFLDDELKVLNPFFKKIYVLLPYHPTNEELHRFIPSNLEIISINHKRSLKLKILSLFQVFNKIFISEFIRIIFNKCRFPTPIILKTMIMDLVKSKEIMLKIKEIILTKGIQNMYFYSYWNDYKALALARLKKGGHSGIYFSRAHSSDIFSHRATGNYLPYKPFILCNLDATFSVSSMGKLELETYTSKRNARIIVSRLGKTNNRTPLFDKNDKRFLFCSCSHFNSLKRVHLIPKLIKYLGLKEVHWVHFGWGYSEYYELVMKELKDCDFTFELMGAKENEAILNFYNENYVDLFINLSTHEGIPVSIMEALSAGIPVMATDVGGTREIVNEQSGFLIHKDFSVSEVAATLKSFLLSDQVLIQNKRKSAYSFWKANYEGEKNYLHFYKELEQLMNKHT
jgi:glycosyltransferase involved in cell wall biosynthesis